jgi:Calpain family cysteine protease
MHHDLKVDSGYISEKDRTLVDSIIKNHPHMKKHAKLLWRFIETDLKRTYERGNAHPWGGLPVMELIMALGAEQKGSKFMVRTKPKMSFWGKSVRKIPFTEPLFSHKKSKNEEGIEVVENWDNPLLIGQGRLGDCSLISAKIAIMSGEYGDQLLHSRMRDLSEYIDDEKTITLAEATGEKTNSMVMGFFDPKSWSEPRYAVTEKRVFSGDRHVLGTTCIQMLEIGYAMICGEGNVKNLHGITRETVLDVFFGGIGKSKCIYLGPKALTYMREEKINALADLITLEDDDPELESTLAWVFDKNEKLIKEFLKHKKLIAERLSKKELKPTGIIKAILYYFEKNSSAIKCYLEEKIFLLGSDKQFSKEHEKLIFEKINELIKIGSPVLFSNGNLYTEEKAGDYSNETKKDGLVGTHCYAVTGTAQLQIGKDASKSALRLFNPWGHPIVKNKLKDGYGRTFFVDFDKNFQGPKVPKASQNSISWFLWEDLLKTSVDIQYCPYPISKQTGQEISTHCMSVCTGDLADQFDKTPVSVQPSMKTGFFSSKTETIVKTPSITSSAQR